MIKKTNEVKVFKYLIDQFADIKVIRFKVPGFENLTLKQKKYIYYLSEAAKSGRDILWLQKSKNSLIVRKAIENILKTYKKERNIKQFEEFLVYAKRVFFSNGMNHHYSNDKFLPKVSKAYFKNLLDNSKEKGFNLEGKSFKEFKKWITNIIYEKNEKTRDLLDKSDVTFYDNVTEREAKTFYEELELKNKKEPISYGLNSKLIKSDGIILEEVYKEDGPFGHIITKIIFWLEKALEECENDIQKEYTQDLIDYYKTGDLKLWDIYNIKWLKETEGKVDYVNGFIETYEDPLGIKATWEALVNVIDEEETKTTQIIADNAEWFEENSPIDEKYKKKNIKGVSAKAINAITLGGDCYPAAPIGINLPNSAWIREKHGSKSVSISNLVKASYKASLEIPKNVKAEFSYNKKNLNKIRELNIIGDNIHTHLHECLGHGSGLLMPNISPNALKEYHSPLEEARADLFALYYMADQKTVDLGIIPSLEVAKTYYESYIKNGLQIQLARIELGCDVVQAHMQARKLISELAYEKGKEDNVIEMKNKNNKTYFVVNDYLKLREIFSEILAEIQRIKSVGDYDAGKKLIDKYGTKVDLKLHEEVLKRYKGLKLKPYTGFINPTLILIKEKDKIIDVTISYPESFLAQQLEYGEKYSF